MQKIFCFDKICSNHYEGLNCVDLVYCEPLLSLKYLAWTVSDEDGFGYYSQFWYHPGNIHQFRYCFTHSYRGCGCCMSFTNKRRSGHQCTSEILVQKKNVCLIYNNCIIQRVQQIYKLYDICL